MGVYEELIERDLLAQVTNETEIKELINNGKGIFYIGIDPTADSLHIGHFLALTLMMRLQKAGNKAIALLGGGTGHIGDPSGKSDLRKMLSSEEIFHNCDCIKKQILNYVDPKETIFVNNADWLLNLKYVDVLRDIGTAFMVNNMLRAECYKLRMEKGLSFLEFNYMVMQAYDFYRLHEDYNCNLQFGGDDQWSNMLAGINLIRKKTGKEAYALTINLLLTSSGQKMGKTCGGAIWLDKNKTSVFDFFQYWRNIDDADVIKCFKMITFVPIEQIKVYEELAKSDINKVKELLAFEITKIVHGENEANKALEMAKSLFSGEGDIIPTITLNLDKDISILDLCVLVNFATSKSEARRLIIQGGLMLGENKVNDVNFVVPLDKLTEGVKLKKGKKNFLKVINK